MKRPRIFNEMFRRSVFAFLLLPFAFSFVPAQTEQPPAPSAPKSVTIPAVKEKKLPNGLTVAVVERKGVPLVTVQLVIINGSSIEDDNKAGLANLTADMLTKGTKTRTATQIAEDLEFLGGSISSGAGWNNSFVTVTVTSDKLVQAMALLADIVLRPKFDEKELGLVKSQTLDELKYNLKQPGFIGNYVASKYSFGEHPPGGTPQSIQSISRSDVAAFHEKYYAPSSAIIVFSGDITLLRASALTAKSLAVWRRPRKEIIQDIFASPSTPPENAKTASVDRLLVVDLPNSGQAAVTYAKTTQSGRTDFEGAGDKMPVGKNYYSGIVTNSVLGGGYSSRLNYEIRIKRGLSYGAGSSFAWRWNSSNFSTRTQTKNESAAEVVGLVLAEIRKLADSSVGNDELVPRKSVLTGNFGRNLETTNGLAAAIGELYSFDVSASELNAYVPSVNAVTDAQIKDFASQNLLGGDIIIVGDYSVFKDDLAKRFPNMKVDVIKADDLDLSKDNLRK